jgi:hypothetical protein
MRMSNCPACHVDVAVSDLPDHLMTVHGWSEAEVEAQEPLDPDMRGCPDCGADLVWDDGKPEKGPDTDPRWVCPNGDGGQRCGRGLDVASVAAALRRSADRLDKVADWPDGVRAEASTLEHLTGQLREAGQRLAAAEPARPF